VVARFRVPVGVTLRLVPEGAIQVTIQDAIQVTTQVLEVLEAAREVCSREQLQTSTGLRNQSHFERAYLAPLFAAGWLELTIPTKPNSRLQGYRTTAAGVARLRDATARRPGEERVTAVVDSPPAPTTSGRAQAVAALPQLGLFMVSGSLQPGDCRRNRRAVACRAARASRPPPVGTSRGPGTKRVALTTPLRPSSAALPPAAATSTGRRRPVGLELVAPAGAGAPQIQPRGPACATTRRPLRPSVSTPKVAVGTALRPEGLGPPPAQIRTGAANASGSYLGSWRVEANEASEENHGRAWATAASTAQSRTSAPT
jgi:hypothetical protein